MAWESEGDNGITVFGRVLAAPTCGDDHILSAVDHESARGCIAAGWQWVFPQHAPREFVKRTDLLISGGRDKKDVSGGENGASKILGAGMADAAFHEFRILAQRNLPKDFAFVQIDRIQCSPS
jgi:hypothetical protein